MAKFSFMFLFCLNNTTKAIPALTISPLINAPKLMPPIAYKFVITTELAQFGINPTSPATRGANPLLEFKKFEILFSPSHSISPLNMNVTTNINANIFSV